MGKKKIAAFALALAASAPLGVGKADPLNHRLIGAWAPSASDCKEVFESRDGALTFRRPVNKLISAFMIGEQEIRGVNASCHIGQSSTSEGYLRIKLECVDAISFLPIDARVKILSDNEISYGDASNDPTIDATYVRCTP